MNDDRNDNIKQEELAEVVEEVSEENPTPNKKTKKKKTVIGISILIVVIIIGIIIFLLMNKPKEENKISLDEELIDTFLVISFNNPSLMLNIDANGDVSAIYNLNDESEIFLENKIKGLTLKMALDIIVDIAKQKNFLTNNEIKISMLGIGENAVLKRAVEILESKNIKVIEIELDEDAQNGILNSKDTPLKEIKYNNFTITFNSDGGSRVEKLEVEEGERIAKPKNPTRKNYTFVEWQLNGKKYDFNTPITKDIILMAIWKEIVIPGNNDSTNKDPEKNEEENEENQNPQPSEGEDENKDPGDGSEQDETEDN